MFRIEWTSTKTGSFGCGEYCLTEQQANAWINFLNSNDHFNDKSTDKSTDKSNDLIYNVGVSTKK